MLYKQSSLKQYPIFQVIRGILIPPTIFFLDFKTKSELSLLPVTFAKHQEERAYSLADKSQSDEEEEETQSFDNTGNEEKVELR